jgi:hypothetical protein
MGVVRAVNARKKVLAAALLAASLAVSGCASQRVAFTQHLRTQYDLTGEELKKLQYYISSDITLQRGFRSEEGEVSGGHTLVRKDKLSAKRWEEQYGELVYGGKTYYAVEGSGQAFLEVVLESLEAVEERKKVLPGITLPGK